MRTYSGFMKQIKKTLSLIILGFILVVGTFLRFYDLGGTPNSLNWDEVSWGYSGYSILQTGKDEYGRFLPTSFEALGDFKQPVYVYLELIPIKILGLTPFAVRLPSALLGTISILFIYLLIKKIFKNFKYNSEVLGLISALFFAISPWSIQFSRIAYEANAALFFMLAGTWGFLKAVESKKTEWFIIGTSLLTISAYTYHSSKIFIPLFFIFLLLYGYSVKSISRKFVLILISIFILVNSIWLIDTRTTQRGRSVLFVTDQHLMEEPSREAIYDSKNNISGSVMHGIKIVYVNTYLENYFSHFNPVWLFFKGDQDRHHAPGFGLLYIVDLPFILIGIFGLLKNFEKRYSTIFTWLVLSPVASALALGAPNASRSLLMLPVWTILASIGWIFLWYEVPKLTKTITRFKKIFFGIFIVMLILNFVYFTHQYFIHINSEDEISWQYGYKNSIEWTSANISKDKKVVFSKNFENPYIFYLFYTKFDPFKYISERIYEKVTDKEHCFSIENYYFGNCIEKLSHGDVYITINGEDYDKGKLLKTFNYSNGPDAVRIYELR